MDNELSNKLLLYLENVAKKQPDIDLVGVYNSGDLFSMGVEAGEVWFARQLLLEFFPGESPYQSE